MAAVGRRGKLGGCGGGGYGKAIGKFAIATRADKSPRETFGAGRSSRETSGLGSS